MNANSTLESETAHIGVSTFSLVGWAGFCAHAEMSRQRFALMGSMCCGLSLRRGHDDAVPTLRAELGVKSLTQTLSTATSFC